MNTSTPSAVELETLQQFADKVVAPEYRQPLKTVREACEAVGWEFEDKPLCCGKPVIVSNLLGPHLAECKQCGKFIADVTGPSFSENGGAVRFIDRDKFPEDTDWDRSWVAGQRAIALAGVE